MSDDMEKPLRSDPWRSPIILQHLSKQCDVKPHVTGKLALSTQNFKNQTAAIILTSLPLPDLDDQGHC